MINAYLASESDLDDHVIHLLFSANRWEKAREMREKLSSGLTLVVDRYAVSGVAFSAAKGLPDMNLEWCKAPDVGLPAPDAVLYLDVSPEVAAARGGYGQERYEKEAFQQEVRRCYQDLRGEVPQGTWHVVDAGRSVDEVHDQVLKITEATVQSCAQGKGLVNLWGSSVVSA